MDSLAERRRASLEIFCQKHGIREVAEASGLNWQYIDQAIKKTLLPPKKDGSRSYRKMSDEAFAKIEDAYQLGRGYFDWPSGLLGPDPSKHPPIAVQPSGGFSAHAAALARMFDSIDHADLDTRKKAFEGASDAIIRAVRESLSNTLPPKA